MGLFNHLQATCVAPTPFIVQILQLLSMDFHLFLLFNHFRLKSLSSVPIQSLPERAYSVDTHRAGMQTPKPIDLGLSKWTIKTNTAEGIKTTISASCVQTWKKKTWKIFFSTVGNHAASSPNTPKSFIFKKSKYFISPKWSLQFFLFKTFLVCNSVLKGRKAKTFGLLFWCGCYVSKGSAHLQSSHGILSFDSQMIQKLQPQAPLWELRITGERWDAR